MPTLALYKGQGSIFNRLIRWWTKSPYSHVELIINGVWYTSSHTDGGVCKRVLSRGPNWDFIEIEINRLEAIKVFEQIEGYDYDWTGIMFTQFIRLDWHSKDEYFCSEVVAKMIGLDNPHRYAPCDFNKLENML